MSWQNGGFLWQSRIIVIKARVISSQIQWTDRGELQRRDHHSGGYPRDSVGHVSARHSVNRAQFEQ